MSRINKPFNYETADPEEVRSRLNFFNRQHVAFWLWYVKHILAGRKSSGKDF